MPRLLTLLACAMLCAYTACAQIDTLSKKVSSITDVDSKVLSNLEKQYGSLQSKLDKQSSKLLSKMQRSEEKLHKKLSGIDSLKAKEVFTDEIKQHYIDLQSKLSQTTDKYMRFPLKEYIPGLDSMQTSLSFLTKNAHLPTEKLEQLKSVSTKLKDLQGQLQKANDIQAFIREREAQLKDQLLNNGLVKQLKGLGKQLKGINKQAFYYQAQLAEYKAMLNDKNKLRDKLLETVRTLPAFQKFWQKNSYLVALFPEPATAGSPAALAGLQTRANIQSLVAQRIGVAAGVNPQEYFQAQVGAAQAQLNELKDKLNKFSNGSGSSDMTMPDFKLNEEKTKSFLKRLEYGFNIQSEKGQYGLPTTSDLALTLGYKLDESKRVGIGASYKMGWGHGIKDIHVSSEGIGIRSYVDIKSPVKSKGIFFSGLWLSGGFEYNYLSSFKTVQELHKNVDVWQKSALLGLSKKYKIGKKESSMQVLYDFLHKQQTPPSQALKFRVGYTF